MRLQVRNRYTNKPGVTLLWVGLLCCLALISTITRAEQKNTRPTVENDMFRFTLMPRTPDQMAAFYEGRGFPAAAIQRIKQACFITAVFRNKSNKVIWLELANWQIITHRGEVKLLGRNYWGRQWQSIHLKRAYQSTFGWTQLPAIRDLQPHEPVGGNITLPRLDKPFTLKAYFVTGKNKRGSGINVTFHNIQCAQDAKP